MKNKFSFRKVLNAWKIQRARFFFWLLRDVINYPLKRLSFPLIMLRFIIMPIDTLYWGWIKPNLQFYDISSDTYNINGIKYSGVLFSTLAFGQLNIPFIITKRDDGMITMSKYEVLQKPLFISENENQWPKLGKGMKCVEVRTHFVKPHFNSDNKTTTNEPLF